MKPVDCYAILQLAGDVTGDEIKKAYRRLAFRYHPDLNPADEEAEEKFKQINQAYAILGDPEKRKLYDLYGTAAFNHRASRDDLSSYRTARFGGGRCSAFGRGMRCRRKARF